MTVIMGVITFLVLTVILAAGINAYPQEEEFLPSNVPRKSSVDLDYAAYGRSFIPPSNFFMRMAENYYYPPFNPARFIPPFPFYPVVPPPIVAPPMIPFPDLSKLPDNYSNTTSEVKTVNGQKVVINQKIDKSKDDNGFFVSHFQTFHSAPDQNSYPTAEDSFHSATDQKTYPTADDTFRSTPDEDRYTIDDNTNPTAEDKVLSNPANENSNRNSFNFDVPHVRKRRDVIGVLLHQIFKMIFNTHEAPANKTLKKNERPVELYPQAEKLIKGPNQSPSNESNQPLLISLENDTRINFGNSIHKLNDDAEIIKNKKLSNETNVKSKSK